MTTLKQQELKQRWDAVQKGAAQAIDWIQHVRPNAPRLDSEADGLILKMHRARNLGRNLARVAQTPMTIGFFGLSQAGKSHLISVLAANTEGRLVTQFGQRTIDFIDHVNPVGTGAEATGVVTRFSRTAKPGPDDFPVELQIFSEIDLAKILSNAYFNDFDQQKIEYEITEDRIHTLLKQFPATDQTANASGVTADDVVALFDYVNGSFGKTTQKLNVEYWPHAIKQAPRLPLRQRAELFSILWGEQPELTAIYCELATVLQRLGNPDRVYAPLQCLVNFANGQQDQSDSIVSVDILQRLGTPGEKTLSVCPIQASGTGVPVPLTVSQLAALTAELIFPLINPTRNPQVEQVDILDFPGYRGREKILSVADIKAAGNPVSQLILRGKVAYLFERYTDQQEMNGLVVCTAEGKQSDVADVGPVLTRWIEKTQGANPAERSRRTPGLMWAITMMDKRIDTSLNTGDHQLNEAWERMFKLTMLERFGQFEWFRAWSDQQAFNNTYLLRKPGLKVAFLQVENGNETGVAPDSITRLQTIQDLFLGNETARKHIADPESAWERLMSLNDGGMSLLSEHIGKIAGIDFKLQRIEEQLNDTLAMLVARGLGPMLQKGGAEALAQKQQVADTLKKELVKNSRFRYLADFLHLGQVPQERLREIYLNTEALVQAEKELISSNGQDLNTAPEAAGTMANDMDDPFSDDPFADDPFASPSSAAGDTSKAADRKSPDQPEIKGVDHHFARLAYKAWVAHIRELPLRTGLPLVKLLGKDLLSLMVDEIVTASSRLDLEGRIKNALMSRDQSGSRREQMVARQVLACQLALGDFLLGLGALELSPDKRPRHLTNNTPVFKGYPDIPVGELPELDDKPRDCALIFGGDWISTLFNATIENAGHLAGSEITIEQNDQLGKILKTITAE